MRALAPFRCAALGLVALAALLALPGGALAAKPAFHDHFTETFADNICGVAGTSTVTVNNVVRFTDTSFKATGSFTLVFVADDGRTATLHSAGNTSGSTTENPDGTVTFVTTYKGLPEQIRGVKGVSTRDAGIISFIDTVDFSTDPPTVVSRVIQHGPHPEADSGFALFCDAFLEALG